MVGTRLDKLVVSVMHASVLAQVTVFTQIDGTGTRQ